MFYKKIIYYDRSINGNIIENFMDVPFSGKIDPGLIDKEYTYLIDIYKRYKLGRNQMLGVQFRPNLEMPPNKIILINFYRKIIYLNTTREVLPKTFNISIIPSYEELDQEKKLEMLIS